MAPTKKDTQRKVAVPNTAKVVDTPVAEKPKRAKKATTIPGDEVKNQDLEPKKSRKRAADVEAENGEPSASSSAPKPEKPKKKAKTAASEGEKPSKVDGHPIEIAKTHPGGDSVEVEPTNDSKGQKGKAAKAKREAEVTQEEEVKKAASAASKSKKPENGGQSGSSTKKTKGPTPKTDAVSKTSTKAPSRKSKKSKEVPEQNEDPSADGEEATSEVVDKEPTEAVLSTETSKESAPKKSKAPAKPKKGAKLSLATSIEKDLIEDSITVEVPAPPKGRKAKKVPIVEDAPESIESKASKPSKTVKEKLPKTSKRKDVTEGDVPKATAKSDLLKEAEESSHDTAEVTNIEKPTSRKRKVPVDKDAETPNLIDILAAGEEVPKKKAKKAKAESSKAAAKVQGVFASGLDAAAQGFSTAKDYVGDLANSAQKSLMGDITEVASEVVDLKKKEKKAAKPPASKKGKGKGTGVDNAPQEEPSAPLPADIPAAIDKTEDTIAAADHFSDENDDSAEEDVEDDQTAALLKGFESTDDEDASSGEGFAEDQKIPLLPNAAKEASNKLKKVSTGETDVGVVYIGRIPHGFFEHQMREYFSQFGNIKRLRLSRNRNTGASKHYAFIEFASAEVAKIVADTMDNYLMFGHILKCKLVPKEGVHENLWKGANKRFKKVPWSKIEGRKLEMGMDREGWNRRIGREEKRRAEKAEKLKEIGIEYEFDGGKLKGVDSVPVRKTPAAVEDVGQEQDVIEQEKTVVVETQDGGGTIIVSEVTTKKGKRSGKKAKELKSDATNVAAKVTATAKDAEKPIEEDFSQTINQAKEAAGSLKKSTTGKDNTHDSDAPEAGPSTIKPTKDTKEEKAAKKEKFEQAKKKARLALKEAKAAKKEKAEKAPKEPKKVRAKPSTRASS